jgi:DNA mismatch endonuclease, patch repair protein
MPDVFTIEKRSLVMGQIRGRGNRDTELRMITLLRGSKVTGWRRNSKLFGKPDFIFPKQRLALFVDGCFWHRHPNCKFSYTPKSRPEFWLPKFARNVTRDQLVTRTLRSKSWRVVRIWECELVTRRQHRVVNRVRRTLEFVPIKGKKTSIGQKISR